MTSVVRAADPPSTLARDDRIDSMEDEEAYSIMMTLQRSLNEDLLLLTLIKVKENLENSSVIKGLLCRNVDKHVVKIMNEFPSSAEIQKVGLELLGAFIEEPYDVGEETHNSDAAYRMLLKTITEFARDEEIQEKGLKILSRLLESENLRNNLLVDDLFGTIVDQSLISMQMYFSNPNIQRYSSLILYFILDEDMDLLNAFIEEKLEMFIKNMKEFLSEPAVLAPMFRVLEIVACAEGHVHTLLSHQIDRCVMDSLLSTPDDLPVVEAACDLLMQLKRERVVQDTLCSTNFLSNTVVPLMVAHPTNASIVSAGLQLFCVLYENVFADKTEEEESQLGTQWCELIFSAMLKLMDKRSIQILGCKAITELLKVCPRAHSQIGENIVNNIKQSPLHSICVGSILKYRRSNDVFACACEALYWLAADNEQICENLIEKNAHLVVLDGIKRHFTWARAVECGLRGLRAMIIFHNANKLKIIVEEIQRKLTQAFIMHAHLDSVIIECISTVACLAEVEIFCNQCLVEKLHVRILAALEKSIGNELMQEAGLECLCVLSAADRAAEILNAAGALNHVIKIMEKYIAVLYIQRKGLVLIQMLGEPSIVDKLDLCFRLIKVLTSTIDKYNSHTGLLKEACVAVHLISELGHDLCDEFVKAGCHQQMFDLLAEHIDQGGTERTDLLDLAGECLVIFGLNETVKSNMLLAECRRGNLAGVQCLLEMEANVNFVNRDGETPLSCAVKNGNEFIVRRLLSKGVNDIKDALGISLQVRHHRITGLLLGALCHKRSSFHVPWSGLGLGLADFSSVWLEMALPTSLTAEKQMSTRSSENSLSDSSWKHITSRVKESEAKRRRRKENQYQHSLSEPSTGVHRHKFRYNFKQSYEDLTGLDSPEEKEIRRRRSSPDDVPRSHEVIYSRRQLSPIGSPVSSFLSPEESQTPFFPLNTTTENEQKSWLFESSHAEGQEWKQMSLTGANLPYSQSDPRVSPFTHSRPVLLNGPWSRKMRSPSPSLTSPNLDFTGDDVFLPERKHLGPTSDGESSDIGRYMSADDLDATAESDDSRRESKASDLGLLVSLDLSSNQLSSLSPLTHSKDDLPKFFSSVEKLALNDNLLTAIPDKFFESMENLHCVDLRKNKLPRFPVEVLLFCPALTSLNLAHNEITDWDLNGHVLSNLTELNLNHNALSYIPDNIGTVFPNLEVLQINSNNLDGLSDETPLGLVNLKKLELNQNNLVEIPEYFLSECSKLDIFEAAFNKIERLPSESAAQYLPRLARLKLRSNNISGKDPLFIPKFILDLPTLKFIDLSDNKLIGLPNPPSWKSQMLKEVLMSKNQISKINLEGGRVWSKLESLHLSNNGLMEIPGDIGQLNSLTSLDISHNPLSTLPDELGKCHKMWELPLHGLHLDLDPALLKGKVKDLIMYLHNRLKRATEYYRMKLMVIGYAGRGKTTLLRALMKKYKTPHTNQATVGVIVQDWKYERKRENRGTVTYTLSTWDFAGQEEFYSTHQCYLSNRALYLVVCNIKEGSSEIERLKPWLCNIQARAPGCPVIVVMTHLDKVPEEKRMELVDIMTDRLNHVISKGGYPEVRHCVPVMCNSENWTIEQLREIIKRVVDDYKVRGQFVMGQKVPASYVKLADLLTETRRMEQSFPVMKHNQLLKIVQDAALDLDEDELHQAVRFLHECGVLLHYPDKALNLRDLYFIDPGWLCRMMAQVVTVHQINPFIKNGILRKKDVNLLFTGKRVENFVFPKDLIPQYLRLLEKFEIALPYSEEELLIPCHLPEKKPHLNIPVLSKNDKICRYYVMAYIPLGMWSRLITRLIVFSQSQVTEVLIGGHEPTLTYWNKGIFMFWSQETFCLVDSEGITGNKEEIAITVPISRQGSMILGLVVDHIDGLIEEWYPGLTTIDPMQGQDLLVKFIPCFMCTGDPPHFFKVEELLQISETSINVTCIQCNNPVPLSQLAPDIVMSDLPPHLLIRKLNIQEKAENLLGDGGFGNVYQMKHQGQDTAVKIFSAIGDIHPHKMLRQEVTVLRCLNHPSVVSLLGVSIQPRSIVLELAPLGSMATVLRGKSPLDKMVQHRIALQVTEGLAYLHKMLIVYRDMKPDNVLIYSLSLSEVVNAKISDYGISRFSTPDGLMAQEGTPAYRAPEVIRGETYSFKADVFSLGITLYALITGGRHPFDDYDFKSEMDRVIAEGHLAPPITQKGCVPWPHMQNIITCCMHQSPHRRPASHEVWEHLKDPEILGLKRIIPISKGTTVECFTIQEQDGGKMYLWVASGDCDYVQLSRLDLMDHASEVKGAMFRYGRILALQPISQGYLLVGTQMCRVWLYDTLRHEFLHCTTLLHDAVLCMASVHLPKKDNLIFVGLANGTLAVFPESDILCEANTNPMFLSPGRKHEAVRCLEVEARGKRVYCSCGSKIILLSVRRGIALEKSFETRKDGRSVPIYGLCVSSKSQVFVCHKGLPVIQVWDISRETLKAQIDVSFLIGLKPTQCRLTSLLLQDNHGMEDMTHGILWAGTGDGRIVLIDSKSGKLINVSHRYDGAIRALKTSPCKSSKHDKQKLSGVLSGGFGLHDIHGNFKTKNRDDDCGCVLLWDREFGKITKELEVDIKRRSMYVKASQERKLSQSQESIHSRPLLGYSNSNQSLLDSQDVNTEENNTFPSGQNGTQNPQSSPENEMFDSL
ncbi:leucine-rich repeat serine/threonine-protein kinase 2-like isoform X2 [Ostrea edulis]|uniref:leucine-rich repeat serine/threonine-protein kinase 2-like isoform X2 n=1 Tax=Ostrea edulis TaxID=37623 RepID=UPI0024AF04FC|nr:leucine-rich repeat serine/threonine-protein kinase 2-like isoform X2 [Ostrea edulis]